MGNSLMTELSATSPPPTEEELDTSSNSQATKNGALSGTQSAEKTSTTLAAVFAPQTALQAWTTSASPAPNDLIPEISPTPPHLSAHPSSSSLDLCVTQTALTKLTESVQSAGVDAQ